MRKNNTQGKVTGKSLDKAADFKSQISEGGIITGSGEMRTVSSGDMKKVDADFENYEEALISEHNNKVDEQVEEWTRKHNEIEEALDKIKGQFDNIGIRPHGRYVLIKPFSVNPFSRTRRLDNGFIVPEFDPHFKSQDTGEIEEMMRMSIFAIVIETSPNAKIVRKGDIIMCNRHECIQVPFYSQGFEVVYEDHIKCVIADESELEQRYNSIREGLCGMG